jgi:hypothetical protein
MKYKEDKYMTNHKEQAYKYKKELYKLQNRVDKCSIDVIDSLLYFLKEADSNMAGLERELMNDINFMTNTFKTTCNCSEMPVYNPEKIKFK